MVHKSIKKSNFAKFIFTFFITILIISSLFILTSCSPEKKFQKQLDNAVNEEITYSTYIHNDFSIDYPYWPSTNSNSDNEKENNEDLTGAEISVTKGFCTVMINTETIKADQWYDMLNNAVKDQAQHKLLIADPKDNRLKYSAPYQDLKLLSDNKFYECGGFTHLVSIVCIEQADDNAQHIHNSVFGSAICNSEEEKEKKEEQEVTNLKKQSHKVVGTLQSAKQIDESKESDAVKKIVYTQFKDSDFSIDYPNWPEIKNENEETENKEDGQNQEHLLGVSVGICSVYVNKHNALPNDLANWIEKTVDEKDDHELLISEQEGNINYIDYRFPYNEHSLTARTKLLYCNYVTYAAITVCIDDLTTNDYVNMQKKVLDSAVCAKEYEIPTTKKLEEKKQEIIEEEPEVEEEIEKIEEKIVQTNIGDLIGIDSKLVVLFINRNDFFKKVMKDFPEANLIFVDEDNELSTNKNEYKIKVTVNGDSGEIILVEDGEFEDPDVTLIVPVKDAINILSNAQNINPITLISFAINVKTEPANIKNQVIQNVLKGKYN